MAGSGQWEVGGGTGKGKWIYKSPKIFEAFTTRGIKRHRVNTETFENLNKALFKWFLLTRTDNIHISGPNLKVKTTEYAEELQIGTFKALNGWLE